MQIMQMLQLPATSMPLMVLGLTLMTQISQETLAQALARRIMVKMELALEWMTPSGGKTLIHCHNAAALGQRLVA